jgi:hypothetical protein
MEGWRGWGEEEVGWVYGGRWSGNGGREGECVCLFVVVGSKKRNTSGQVCWVSGVTF